MENIRLTLCGAGRRRKDIYNRVFAFMHDVEIVGIADLSPKNVNSVADSMLKKQATAHICASYQEMFDVKKADAVCVASN